jgi:hypothetical protein
MEWYKTMLDGKVVMDMGEMGGPCVVKAAKDSITQKFQ